MKKRWSQNFKRPKHLLEKWQDKLSRNQSCRKSQGLQLGQYRTLTSRKKVNNSKPSLIPLNKQNMAEHFPVGYPKGRSQNFERPKHLLEKRHDRLSRNQSCRESQDLELPQYRILISPKKVNNSEQSFLQLNKQNMETRRNYGRPKYSLFSRFKKLCFDSFS